MKNRIIDQVAEIIAGKVTADELTEIEKIVQEAKGKVGIESSPGYWENKTPCWEMCSCPSSIHNECPSFRLKTQPCWEMEGTYCKLDDYGGTGRDISICQVCRVYKRYSNAEPIEIKLFGQGMNPTFAGQKAGTEVYK